ncbi:MAG: formate dehydrogenase accessory sulfurtransferase FdhD [Bacteroidota bacterium]
MRHAVVSSVRIVKISAPDPGASVFSSVEADDLLAVEEPLEIGLVHGPVSDRKLKSLSVTMCTPGNDTELAVGFLFTEGIIRSKNDIVSVNETETEKGRQVLVALQPGCSFDPARIERHFYTSSSCGVCGKTSIEAVKQSLPGTQKPDGLQVAARVIAQLPQSLREHQNVFRETGGLHAAAYFETGGNLLLTREDVGRHNALDKLVGAALEAGKIPLDNGILLLSGRASFELIQKAAMAGIRIVCAVGAPSSLAVELAGENGMTLVGFLRDGRFNIYCGAARINAKT